MLVQLTDVCLYLPSALLSPLSDGRYERMYPKQCDSKCGKKLCGKEVSLFVLLSTVVIMTHALLVASKIQ